MEGQPLRRLPIMLCVRAAVRTLHSLPPSLRRKPLSRRSPFSVSMSSSASPPISDQIIEHVVLLKAKPDADPAAVNAMITNINGLAALDSVLCISAGAVARCHSSSGSLTFTHMLHARYRSKSDLASYTDDPTHVGVVVNHVTPVVDDVMAVDWVADGFSGAVVPPGAALRLTVLKLKEEAGESGKSEVLAVAKGIKEKLGWIEQLTVGENFSMERGKGFSIASIAVVKEAEELGGLESEVVVEEKEKVKEFLDDVVVIDYAPASV